MSNETTLAIVGNLTADPELRYTNAGKPVANITIVSTPRRYDSATGTWEDGTPMFLKARIWNRLAENFAESATKGTRVIATGNLTQQNWEDKEGARRSALVLDIHDIGVALTFATAQVERNQMQNSSNTADDWSNDNAGAPF